MRVLLLTLILASCGGGSAGDGYDSPAPAPAPQAPVGKPSGPIVDNFTAVVKPVVEKNCGKCHKSGGQKPVFTSGDVLRNSNAARRIQAGTMPPGGGMSGSDKKIILDYIGT